MNLKELEQYWTNFQKQTVTQLRMTLSRSDLKWVSISSMGQARTKKCFHIVIQFFESKKPQNFRLKYVEPGKPGKPGSGQTNKCSENMLFL